MLLLKGNYAGQARAASGMNILLGIWLMISPWVFGNERPLSVTTSVFVGFLIAILAACRLAEFRLSMFLSAVNFVLALWTVAAPWAIGYTTNGGAVRNNVIVGLAIAILAVWSAGATVAWKSQRTGAVAR